MENYYLVEYREKIINRKLKNVQFEFSKLLLHLKNDFKPDSPFFTDWSDLLFKYI